MTNPNDDPRGPEGDPTGDSPAGPAPAYEGGNPYPSSPGRDPASGQSGQGSPSDPGTPGYGVPGYADQGYGTPGYGAPEYGTPGYSAPGYGAPQYGAAQYGPGGYPVIRQTNGKAIAALVCGIGSFLVCPGVLGVVAVILGNSARDEIARSAGTQDGEGMAKAGAILGWISIALVLAALLVFLLVLVVGAAVSV
ncbi:DUF4190 domain-containing protein [Gordonia sp. LSe1-13]|uniref:DUF4190 domain-containing protein n=1 Tax=Gordonia sesuvii TaxID=3116777 RepID=A0ABU7M7R7_9ACTN|nr:DUF4190 domain-containing protein [Gordonia sp. LSe1-13]